MLGLLGAIQNIGSLGAMPFSPYMNDILGRRRTVWFGACVMVMGTIIQTASQSVRMFIGARFMRPSPAFFPCPHASKEVLLTVGFGLGFSTSGAPMLISEIAYP